MNLKTNNPLLMPSDSRGLLTGQTGTGKSTLAQVLVQDKRNLLIVDAKNEFIPSQEYELATTLDQLEVKAKVVMKENEGRTALLYRPSYNDLEDMDMYNALFKWAFLRENTFVYVDEALAVCKGPMTFPHFLKVIYTQGRSKNVGILSASQRPVGIPTFMRSEAAYFWKFFLGNRADQEVMAEYMGDIVLEPKDKNLSAHDNPYSFFFKNIRMRGEAEEFVLDINTHKTEQ